MGSAREIALVALRERRARKNFANSILTRLLDASNLTSPDRAFATELFYGVLRNLTLLDYWINTLRAEWLDHDARDLLRLGFFQLFVLDTSEHAAVYETVAQATRKQRSLINAVLRSALRRREELLASAQQQSLSVRTSHPQFLIDRWTNNFGPDNAVALCQWNNQTPPAYARVNRLRIDLEQFLRIYLNVRPHILAQNFFEFETRRLKAVEFQCAIRDGHCYIQDPSTHHACELLAPERGERILDACAAPGGKASYLAEFMQNNGTIVAVEQQAMRIEILKENLKRLGVTIAQIVQHDWTRSEPAVEIMSAAPFDRILVDAPCTNTGVMRRRVDLRWRLRPEEFARMRDEQRSILRAIIPLLKINGTLVYSTCSIEPEENEEVVRTITNEFPVLKFAEQKSSLPFRDGFDGAYAAKLIRVE